MDINLVNEIKVPLKQNDLYFINRTQDYVIVNDDYRGVIIYTPQLEYVDSYILDNTKVIILNSFVDSENNRIVLHLEAGLWYIDLNRHYSQFIKYDFESECIYILYFSVFKSGSISIFSSSLMIQWDFVDNNLSFIAIDKLSSCNELTLYRNWERELKGANSIIGFIDNKWIVYEEDIEIYQDNRLVYKFPMEYSKWYRFDINGDYFVAINEFTIVLTSISNTKNRIKKIYTNNEACYGAVLIHDKGFSYLALLIVNERTGDSYLRSYTISE
ncbi:hypothetical protein [Veillonella parvula]|uniref:Uncharacterized protein n=1 Tax=Veillonella parvula TaxID=29466 RepID=A0AB38YPU6_VEIPA|nr:hypothetical protein [Veillonella parvula]EFB86467.1 hypothetical protein HMPREF1035_0316 [Veillonella parvula ATCC 17745]WMS19873.1 hypothetical protein RDV51_00615 [Veillonella parvula]